MKNIFKTIFILYLLFIVIALSFAKQSAMDYYNQGLKYKKNGDYQKSIAMFDKAIQLDPTIGWAYRNAANVLIYKLKEYQKGIDYLKKGQKYLTDDYYINIYTGYAYYKLKKYKEAVNEYDKAIAFYKKNNKNPASYIIFHCSQIYRHYLNKPDYKKAASYLLLIINNDYGINDKDQAIQKLAKIYYDGVMYKELLNLTDKYLKDIKDDNYKKIIFDTLADYYYLVVRDFDKALSLAKKGTKKGWTYRILAPNRVILNCSFRLKKMTERVRSYKPGIYYINMPLNTYYQKLVQVKSNPSFIEIVRDGRNNYAVFDFTKGFPELLEIEITINHQVVNAVPEEVVSYPFINSEIAFYANLKNDFFNYKDKKFNSFIKELTKDTKLGKDIILLTNQWIRENIEHPWFLDNNINNSLSDKKKVVDNYNNILQIQKTKIGGCSESSYLYAGMTRTHSLPNRIVGVFYFVDSGYLDKNEGYCYSHFCNEVYDSKNMRWALTDRNKDFENDFRNITFYTESLRIRPDNYLDFYHMFFNEFLILKNDNAMRFKIIQNENMTFSPDKNYKKSIQHIDEKQKYFIHEMEEDKFLNVIDDKLTKVSKKELNKNSTFKFVKIENGFYKIAHATTGKVIQFEKNDSEGFFILNDFKNIDSQKFAVFNGGFDYYYIIAQNNKDRIIDLMDKYTGKTLITNITLDDVRDIVFKLKKN